MRASVVLLAVLVALCAADLAGPAMVMADEQGCTGPFCDIGIGCGQPTQPQTSSGSALHFVATPASGERLLPPAMGETRTVDRSPGRVTWQALGPPASRAPPAV